MRTTTILALSVILAACSARPQLVGDFAPGCSTARGECVSGDAGGCTPAPASAQDCGEVAICCLVPATDAATGGAADQ